MGCFEKIVYGENDIFFEKKCLKYIYQSFMILYKTFFLGRACATMLYTKFGKLYMITVGRSLSVRFKYLF